MGTLSQSFRRIPFWAYLLVLTAVFANTIYMVYRYQASVSGETSYPVNGHWIINFIRDGGPVGRTEINQGDTIVSCNGIPIAEWVTCYRGQKAGDTLIFGILRNNKEIGIPVLVDSKVSIAPGLYWTVYIVMILTSICSLYILIRKRKDKAARLFFIYIQFSTIAVNSASIAFPQPIFVFTHMTYIFSVCLMGPVLIHFHLLFPRSFQSFRHIRMIPALFYVSGGMICIYTAISYYLNINPFSGNKDTIFNLIDRIALFWVTLTFLLALIIVILQYLRVKNTLSRHQMLIVFTGSFFGFLTPIIYGLFYDSVNYILSEQQNILPLSQATGSFLMICCILIAIFRYRIWDIEVVIRKALLYLGATAVIILTYLFLIWLVDQFTAGATDIIRFTALAASVILFLALRDRTQHLIDRLFHRETYDSATVVSDFEAKLAGIYRFEELKQKIAEGLDQIFHFKSFVFSLKKGGLFYEPAFIIGNVNPMAVTDYAISRDMEEKLQKSKVFSPEELNQKPPLLEAIKGDLIVPMVSGGQPEGFFICGQKKSERIYSRQDINVLSLLACRVIALLYTASLYQKDLDRQLMLERERARISQDMHDDIGAGLTKIAMISEAPSPVLSPQSTVCSLQSSVFDQQSPAADCRLPTADLIQDRLNRIASTSREMISRLNVIVWALNPKYDNLESLVSYLRRYFGEYLENFNIRFKTDLPDQIPDISITPDTRRNIFYAIQEATHNAVKHSGCSEISISVKIGNQKMEITITDNGKGFEQIRPSSGGNGLQNMKKRAEEIGGSFEIQSSSGKGTNVIFNIEL